MGIDQIASEAFKLPAKERAMLAASLWESVEDPFELASSMEDEEAFELAEARDRELDNGTAAPLSHDDLMLRLRS